MDEGTGGFGPVRFVGLYEFAGGQVFDAFVGPIDKCLAFQTAREMIGFPMTCCLYLHAKVCFQFPDPVDRLTCLTCFDEGGDRPLEPDNRPTNEGQRQSRETAGIRF